MKIRSLLEFETALDREFTWRRQEITTLKFALTSARHHQLDVFFRSGVVLLYAHWEGLVKFGAKAYLAYINHQSPSYPSMGTSFLFFAVKEALDSSGKINLNNYAVFEKTRDFFTVPHQHKFSVNAESYIATRENQNLTSTEFKAIVCKLGLTYLPIYELREKLIDDKLLDYRNRVAHGESLRDDIDNPVGTFDVLSDKVLELLDALCDQLRQAVKTKSYLST